MFCNQCGVKLSANAKFCHNCGTKVVEVNSSQINNSQNEVDNEEDGPSLIEICDQLALKGDYKEIIKVLSPKIKESDLFFEKNGGYVSMKTQEERDEAMSHHWINNFGLITRAKIYYLLGDYERAFKDIDNLIQLDEDEAAPEDVDLFIKFDSPSLKKVCKKLEKEGYDLRFYIEDIDED